MATPFFRFDRFRLDPQARELFEDERRVDLPLTTVDCLIHLIRHRERPIGRDELASAVWGRVDVSEVSLTHAIMRLRRALGDDGNAQRYIRTVPRHGYRWVADVETVVPDEAGAPPADIADTQATSTAEPPDSATTAPTSAGARHGRAIMRIAIALGVLVLLIAAWIGLHRRAPQKPVAAAADSALVLPVAVAAGVESSWLRLGLMDLIANQLRRGGLATTPSETVVSLLDARHFGDPAEVRTELPVAWLVRPTATLANGVWDVRLQANGDDGPLDIEVHADDPLKAARDATDELLIRLGHTPPNDDFGDAALAAATLRQRINAALLSGQVDIARELVEQAPAALQASPEVALGKARIAFFSGDYAGSEAQATQLIARLPDDTPAELRARVLNALGSAAFRQGRFDAAQSAFAETVALLPGQQQPDVLANARRGLGSVASERGQLAHAAEEYGHARTLYEIANDPFGVATVDLNLGINAMQRGQPAVALPLLEGVRARLQHLAAPDALAAAEVTLIETQLALLDHAGALATSAEFLSPAHAAGNPRLHWQFTFARAAALCGVGRLSEADTLLARLRDSGDPAADALARALADSLAARIALERGDDDKAVELAVAAQTPTLEQRNRNQYAEAVATQIRALQRSAHLADAQQAIARLAAWNAQAPEPAIGMLLTLAGADQAAAEGHSEAALQGYADAMAQAAARAVPDELVRVGLPYVRELIAAHRLDEAVSVNGRIAPWADRDMRAAWSEALVYTALGQSATAARALDRARRLAGERSVSDTVTATH